MSYDTNYPTSIPTRADLPVYVDNVDDVEASVVNDPNSELLACLAELGTLPKGEHASVAARLSAVEMTSRARAYNTGAPFSINATTWTRIPLNASDFDSLSELDLVTDFDFTAKAAGYYFISAGASFIAAGADERYQIRITRAGTALATDYMYSIDALTLTLNLSLLAYLTTDAVIAADVYHTYSAARLMPKGSAYNWLAVHKLSSP